MKPSKFCPIPRLLLGRCGLSFAAVASLALAGVAQAAESTDIMVKPPVPLPGGLGLQPVITSITKTQDLVTVQWFGIQGPFQVLHSSSANSNAWANLGQPTFRSRLTTALPGEDLGFFRVLSGLPTSSSATGGTLNYVGAAACADCHQGTHSRWADTAHAGAFETLKRISQDKNSACVGCHTVGFGTPLGFKDELTTPHLVGVQCENCHGPAGNHTANVRDPAAYPKVTVAAEVCGGCHNDFHHPTFDEWKLSAHSTPNPEVASSTLQQGESRMLSCGVCHSGAVREALLISLRVPGTPLPNRVDAAHFGITCSACHSPHVNTPNPAQLRNPVFSLENYSFSTSTSVSFAEKYNPAIQLCGQCHNMRGARWQDTARPPHHSPQYNILVGKGAHDLGQTILSAHSEIENQCVNCHTHPHEADPVTPENPNYTGHTFEVRASNCVECHITERAAERAVERTQEAIKAQIEAVRALLDDWATSKAPADLQAKYGRLAWEYTSPGQLSNPEGDSALRGPSAAEQAAIPEAIKQARMNLYLVEHDGSYGVHNGAYARYLLNVARTNVTGQLALP